MRFFFLLLVLTSVAFAEFSLTVAKKPSVFREAVVECQLHGRFLIRDLTLTFYNEGQRVAEGDLTCPLEVGEEIVSFAMDVNGVRREGVVVPKKRGRVAYERIVRRGVDPGLIEVNEVTNEFRTQVFPIPVKGTKTVWIKTVQMVEAGEVTVWPKGLGRPEKWSFSLETAGGEGGAFKENQSGDSASVPVSKMSWKATEDLAYRSDHGDLHFLEKVAPKFSAESLEIWFDGATEMSPKVAGRLGQLLKLYKDAKVTLRVFREEVGEAQEFDLAGGRSAELFQELSKIPRIGMARPRGLPWKTVHADAVIFITDGAFVSGRAGLGETACPLHVIDSGKGTSEWLRCQALRSGGGWHSLAQLDPIMGPSATGAMELGKVMNRWVGLRPSVEGLETPIGDWLWARLKSQKMKDEGVARLKIDQFNHRHGVMDSSSSMIVLETARQYREFGFVPPKEDVKLYQEWLGFQRKREDEKKRDFDDLAKAWERRCDALGGAVIPLGERIKIDVETKLKRLKKIETFNEDADLVSLAPVRKELFSIRELCGDGIKKDEIPRIKEHFAKLVELEEGLKVEVPWIDITVGGQVKKPGVLTLYPGVTLYHAIQEAGGETPFGAINRVKLYRNGQVYTYNLKMDKHKGVKLYPGDLVEVPQKQWMGNGGSAGKEVAPFAEEEPLKMVFEKGDANPSKYYVQALAKVLSDDSQWEDQYRVYRSTFGWRADFYLNVIEFLREKNEVVKARKVAGDLAEHMPENPEILRRAAKAYRRIGEMELSYELFLRVAELLPEDAISHYDLARIEDLRGNAEEAVTHYWKAITFKDSHYTWGRSLVALEELNAVLSKTGLRGEDYGIDPRLICHVPVDLRVVLEWDADQSNIDILTRRLSDGWLSPALGVQELPGAWWSGNVTKGYGPESLSLRGLFPGGYSFGARFYGDWNDKDISTVTAEIRVIRNFGTAEETEEVRALRLEEKTHGEILKAQVVLPGWE
ncbi:MAG: tetratricopeptide (TPR) repeat protein [Akkermansiaceae bacterium]|jgi:tetratricopeptide (TPR) repeat protein